jgi:uncharacterized membrane protein
MNMANNGSGGFLSKIDEEKLAIGLGWFSIGLGLAELTAPRKTARLMGVKEKTGLMRTLGLRELASGIGILTRKQPKGWLWARVVGDAIDLAILGTSIVTNDGKRGRATFATAAVAGVTALDVLCSQKVSKRRYVNISAVHVRKSLTVNKSPQELYKFWRNFEAFPSFMNHLKSVKILDERRSHWVAKAPAGSSVEWDAEIIYDKPNELIAWRSLPGADVENSGSVRFERSAGNRGTIVRVEVEYNPPAGVLGSVVAKLFGEAPEKQITVDLMRFKQLIETGEVARTEGQPAGRMRSTSRKYDDLVRAGA